MNPSKKTECGKHFQNSAGHMECVLKKNHKRVCCGRNLHPVKNAQECDVCPNKPASVGTPLSTILEKKRKNPKPCPLPHKTVLDDCSALPMPLPDKSHPAGEQEWREMWTTLSYAFEKDKEPDDDTKARLSHTVLMLLQAKDREKDEAIREMLKQVEKKIKSRVYGYDMDERSGCVEWSDVSDIFASLKK